MFAIIYNIGISIIFFLAKIVALFNSRVKKTLSGQHNTLSLLNNIPAKKGVRYWFHCASLGEFEMAIPMIETLKKQNTSNEIYVSFFSPSGYEKRKDYACNGVFYLPPDKASHVRKWYNSVDPDVCILVKYDFWYNYLRTGLLLNKKFILVNGRFHQNHFIFKFIGQPWKKLLQQFEQLFVIDKGSLNTLQQAGFNNVSLSGDTRYDRVWEISINNAALPAIDGFKGNKKVLILGSSWPEEEDLLHELLYNHQAEILNEWKIIIAPHDISPAHIQHIEQKFSVYPVKKYSDGNFENATILVIDNIGLLGKMYRYADMALIGGGFGKGLHNILEACSFGMPVFFGPKIQKFPEAQESIDLGFGNLINNYNEFETAVLFHLKAHPVLSIAQHASREMVKSRLGATEWVINALNRQA